MNATSKHMVPLAKETTALLKALGHPARLMICCELRDTELSVGEIENLLGIRQPRLSRELGKLRDEGLVETRRESKVVFYRLAAQSRAHAMVDAICAVMLDKPLQPSTAPSAPRQGRPGGYGVFARTAPVNPTKDGDPL